MRLIRQSRGGFTLVELLVVMALMAIMAAMAVAFLPNAASANREARAALQLQGWLNIAKQRALRDQVAGGLRLWVSSPTIGATTFNNAVVECQYVAQPDDFAGSATNQISYATPTWANGTAYPLLSSVIFKNFVYYSIRAVPAGVAPPNPAFWRSNGTYNECIVDFVGPPGVGIDITDGYALSVANPWLLNPPSNNTDTNLKYWSIQPGDYLEVMGTGLMHRVNVIYAGTTAGVPWSKISVSPPLPYAVSSTPNYRIARAPRVVGDETLKMPDYTMIDLNTNQLPPAGFNNPLPQSATDALNVGTASYVDIVFAPSGAVILRGVTTSNIHLWVRAPSEPKFAGDTGPLDPFRGDPTIVSVFVRTGFVGAYPPNPNVPPAGAGPYNLVK